MSSDLAGRPGPEPEYLGPEQTARGGGRRWALVATAAVGVAAVGGAGAWALTSFLSSGPAPADVLPADTYAYVALDMDPSGGQKVEAWKTLRKFPALRDELGLESGDDIRRWLFEAATGGLDCDTTFADVDGWLGSTAAVAVVPDGDTVAPVGVLEVTDEDAARAGMLELAGCVEGTPAPGLSFAGDFMVVAETDELAAQVTSAGQDDPLVDDATHDRWIEEAGDPGVVTAYVAPSAPEALMHEMPSMGPGAMPDSYAGRPGALVSPDPEPGADPDEPPFDDMPMPMAPMLPMLPMPGDLAEAFEDFEGMAMVIRFDDGALEGEMAMAMPDDVDLPEGGSGLADLPDTSAIAFGIATGDGWVEQVLDAVEAQVGEEEFAEGVAELEAETGLSVPEDLEALLGDGVGLAVDSSIDLSGMFGFGSAGPEELPVGLRIAGDPAEIRPALDKLLAAIGSDAEQVVVVDGEDAVAVGLTDGYTEELAGDGGLGDLSGFTAAMDGMDTSSGALYIDFDAGAWLEEMSEGESGDEEANVAPLRALGVGGRVDDGVARMVFRLTTD